MRASLTFILIITVLFASGYFFYTAQAVCPVPIAYRVGTIDERFKLSDEDVRLAALEAEAVWENATGHNLFRYDDAAKLTVNLVFDERQALAEEQASFEEVLDEKESTSESLGQTYAQLLAEYETLSTDYEARANDYEARLGAYNAEVAAYNEEGGAPPAVYRELRDTGEALDREASELNALARELNQLSLEINRLGEEGNALIESYNEDVERYNRTFGESTEFTQGDYQDGDINVYKFSDRSELLLVLAHEFGHALGIEHVEGDTSIMYYLMGGQPETPVLSDADQAAFVAACGDGTGWFARWRAS